MEIGTGKIQEFYPDGRVVISAILPNLDKAITRKYDEVQIGYQDGRRISPEQRRKVYALIREIAEWMGDYEDSTKEQLKMEFVLTRMQSLQRKMFSLSDVDMNTCSMFIEFLINFIIEHEIPTRQPLVELAEDIGKMIYAQAMHKQCCVCGRTADLHHIEGSRIGMGSNREEVHHLGREMLPLCREHHTLCHQDENKFIQLYHLQPIKIDEAICKKYKIKE